MMSFTTKMHFLCGALTDKLTFWPFMPTSIEKIKSWSKLLSIILLLKKSKENREGKHSTSKQENKDCTMEAPYWTCLALLSVLLLCPIH
jgi:hypothetical protein